MLCEILPLQRATTIYALAIHIVVVAAVINMAVCPHVEPRRIKRHWWGGGISNRVDVARDRM